jgi:hypothetical protein
LPSLFGMQIASLLRRIVLLFSTLSHKVTRRRGRRRRKLLDDRKEMRGYSHLKEGALDCTVWRAHFRIGFGPVVRQTTKLRNESHKRHVFRKKKTIDRRSVFWFSLQLLFETFLFLRRSEWDAVINVHRSSCKAFVILVTLQWNLKFLDRFSKNPQVQNFMKILFVGAELFHADRQTATWRT